MNRVLTAVVMVPVVLAAVCLLPDAYFAVAVVVVALMALREFYDLAQGQGAAPYRWLGLVAAAAVVLYIEMLPALEGYGGTAQAGAIGVGLWLAIVGGIGVRALSRPERASSAVADAGATLLGILYLGLLMGATGAIRIIPGGDPTWLLFLLGVVWLGDTAAYYAGRAWGRHAMAPSVSPKKTWEGAAASGMVAILVGWGFGRWFVGPSWFFAALGLGMNVAAQAGDLVESLFKRGSQVKDSGSLLPGHGGVLDRIDAMLWAAPVLWYYLTFIHA